MASHYKGAIQCLLLIHWKYLVSEVRTGEKMCLSMFLKVDNVHVGAQCGMNVQWETVIGDWTSHKKIIGYAIYHSCHK